MYVEGVPSKEDIREGFGDKEKGREVNSGPLRTKKVKGGRIRERERGHKEYKRVLLGRSSPLGFSASGKAFLEDSLKTRQRGSPAKHNFLAELKSNNKNYEIGMGESTGSASDSSVATNF